ncbi:hypothetical protein BD560DRAFT_429303 [Blakeslea trispora]|nr:hypothetical protein BD560DRAFT_429303 [Blakeslea trispora]
MQQKAKACVLFRIKRLPIADLTHAPTLNNSVIRHIPRSLSLNWLPQKHNPIKPFSIQTDAIVVLICLHKMIEHLFSLNVIKLSSVRVLCHTHTEISHFYTRRYLNGHSSNFVNFSIWEMSEGYEGKRIPYKHSLGKTNSVEMQDASVEM